MPFACGSHRAHVYARGGEVYVGELTPVSRVQWERVRDEISTASCTVPVHECCELLGNLRTILSELHIERNGKIVWQGPITRIEYEHEQVQIYAEDVLWAAKRKVLQVGYDQTYPNIANVIDRMDWLLRQQCYAKDGDPWRMVPHLHPVHHSGDPRTSRSVFANQFYVWEDFDLYAEDSGTDYMVINRDVYYWDTNLAWLIIPPLDEQYLSQFPRIVEYGNELATRGFVNNGTGPTGYAQASTEMLNLYGAIDWLTTHVQDGTPDGATPEEIAEWNDSARRQIDGRAPTPVSVNIPANTTLMPGAPWTDDDLIPGAWFEISVLSLCRQLTAWQRLQHIIVTEEAPGGETVQITAIGAPGQMIIPP